MSSDVKDPSDELSPSREFLPEELTNLWDIGNEQNWLKSRRSQGPDSLISLEQFLRVELPPRRSSSEDSYKTSSSELPVSNENNNDVPSLLSIQDRRLSYTLPKPSVILCTPNRDHSLLENVTPPSAYSKISDITISETASSDGSYAAKRKIVILEKSVAPTTPSGSANSSKKALEEINEDDLETASCIEIGANGSSSGISLGNRLNTAGSDFRPKARRIKRDEVPPAMNVSFTLISPDGGSEICKKNPNTDESIMNYEKTSTFNLDANNSHSNFEIVTNYSEPSSLEMSKNNVVSESVSGTKPPFLSHENTYTAEDKLLRRKKYNLIDISLDFAHNPIKDIFFPGEKVDREENIVSEDKNNELELEDKQSDKQLKYLHENDAIIDETLIMMKAFPLDDKINSSLDPPANPKAKLVSSSCNHNVSFDEEEIRLLGLCSTPRSKADRGSRNANFSKMSPDVPEPCGPGSVVRRGTFVINNSRVFENCEDIVGDMTLRNNGLHDTTLVATASVGDLVSHINSEVCPNVETIPSKQSSRPSTSFIRKPSLMSVSSVPDVAKEVAAAAAREIALCSTSSSLSNLTIQNHRPRWSSKIPIPARLGKLYINKL